MSNQVKITTEIKITVEGLCYEHFRASKSEVPTLALNRLKKELRDEKNYYETFLSDWKSKELEKSENILQQVRDFLKTGYRAPYLGMYLKDKNSYDYVDNNLLQNEFLYQPGCLDFYPLDGVKITKDTTDEEIHNMCVQSADDYEKTVYTDKIKKLENDIANFNNQDYYLWICPESDCSISVDSRIVRNAKYLYDALKAKRTLDVVFYVDNCCGSYSAHRVDIVDER